MKIGFRTTASHEIGFGHLRRCLTLAAATKQPCVFFVQPEAHAQVRGFEVREWTGAHDCDVLVCDDYTLDGEAVRGSMVLDDPMERSLQLARWIVNPMGGASYDSPAQQLIGLQYAMVRDEFRGFQRRQGPVRRILVTMGGADPDDRTLDVLRALRGLPLEVVVGPLFSERQRRDLPALGVSLHDAPDSLAELMRSCDMTVCAGGQTLYEVCAMGLPAIAIELASNQTRNLARLSAEGVLRVSTLATLRADTEVLMADEALRADMAARGQALVDGHGAARVAAVLMEQGGNDTPRHNPRHS